MARIPRKVTGGKKIVSFCHDGIGLSNRIKNILSCHRMYNEVEVYWTKGKFGYAPLNFYFPSLKATNTYANKDYWQSWRLIAVEGDVPKGFSDKNAKYKKETGDDLCPFGADGVAIDFEYDRIPQNVKDRYLKIIEENLAVNSDLLGEAQEFVDKNFSDEMVSVHIRTFKDSKFHSKNFFKGLDKYAEVMEQYPNAKFYVASDKKESIEYMEERFGKDRIVSRPTVTSYKDDFIELLLVGYNDTIIGTPHSTFTEVAWWLGGAEAKVHIV